MKHFSILSALLLLGMLCACGDTGDTVETVTCPADTAPTTETASPEDLRPTLGLEARDFGGAEYRISTFQESDMKSLYAETTDGEAVNDAIYTRNTRLMEDYNFKFVIDLATDYQGQTSNISKLAMAGDDAFELVSGHVVTTCNNAIKGIYLNLYDVPNLDFTKPWWPAQSVEQMTVYDRMYTICSGINYQQLAASKVLFFNKEILAANDLSTPYEWVRDGSWTMDRLMEQTKGLYLDVNGDSTRDMSDQYGFTSYWSQNGFLMSCDAQILSSTADGGREITVMSDKMVSLVEKIYGWWYESGDVYLAPYDSTQPDYLPNVFGGGHAAYAFGHLSHAVQFYREADISYGVAPMPKYDEGQESYMVFACPSLFSIPISAQNTDFAGFIFEAMTYYGYYNVNPVYYEQTLQGKIADSQDDAEMLSIINDHLTVSFAYCYDNWEGFAHLLGSRLGFTQKKGSKDLASMYEKYNKKAQARLDSILEGFSN